MHIKAGYHLTYDCRVPTPMLLCLNLHPSRHGDLVTPEALKVSPEIETSDYIDGFGNICTRLVAPAGRISFSSEFVISDSGQPDIVPHDAVQHDIHHLPDEVLVFLLGSRYCETDRLSDLAWNLFGNTAPGWPRVQAILDYAHKHIRFDYQRADSWRGAYGAYADGTGVCRDYAHLALTLCRCMNIPARYCTGYLGEIDIRPSGSPIDFSGWFEVFLGGRWYPADARHNIPRVGRILMAIGRDATDVAISTQFGPALLTRFEVITEAVA